MTGPRPTPGAGPATPGRRPASDADRESHGRRFASDADRGVSTTLSYVLTLAITTILISGLLAATGGVVDDRREVVTRDELDVIGQQVASKLMSADRLAATGAESVVLRPDFPDRVAGVRYTVEVNASAPDPHLLLSADDVGVSVRVPFVARTPVADTTVGGGDLRIELNGAGQLAVSRR